MFKKGNFSTSISIVCILLLINVPLSSIETTRAEHNDQLTFEPITDTYSIDGFLNHPAYPDYNGVNTDLIRLIPSEGVYEDNWVARADSLSPREISNIACENDNLTYDDELGLSDFNWIWGQFITHDIDFTLTQNGRVNGTPETLHIPIPVGDEWMDPYSVGSLLVPMHRSLYNSSTGNETIPREFPNSITGWLDGSMVYGSSLSDSIWLREGINGRLKVLNTPVGDFLPIAEDDDLDAPKMSFVGFSSSERFIAGDPRANEHASLTAMHVLFIREHNRLATEIFSQNPSLSDEEIYQIARKINIAQIQYITYFEYLPSLGINLPSYSGFDPSIDPRISNEFATLAFRMGHSQIKDITVRLGYNYSQNSIEPIQLSEGFWNPARMLDEGGISPILRGAAYTTQAKNDIFSIHGLRNAMFGLPGFGGLDMCAIDIQRGRDHGIPSYNSIREFLGFNEVISWSNVTNNSEVITKMNLAYPDVEIADPIMGMYAEQHVPNSPLGETMHELISEQYLRLRDGDRLYFENDLQLEKYMDQITESSLAAIILRNTEINLIQCDVMYAQNIVNNMQCESESLFEEEDFNPYIIDTEEPLIFQPEITNRLDEVLTLVNSDEIAGVDLSIHWSSYGPTIAIGDCNDDGYDDVWVGATFDHEGWETGEKQSIGRTYLFRNEGGGSFQDISIESGLLFLNSTYLGASWADFDNDGDLDIYLSNYGYSDSDDPYPNKLFQNNGNCNFIDVTIDVGLGNVGHSSSSSWADYDHDGDLDLHSSNLGELSESRGEAMIESDIFYKNLLTESGNATFIDFTSESGEIYGSVFKPRNEDGIAVAGPYSWSPASANHPSSTMLLWHFYELYPNAQDTGTGLSHASLFVDLDDDGFEDLFVATDFGKSVIYRNTGDGGFTQSNSKFNINEFGTAMGLDAGDVDGDGDIDICQTNFGPNFLYIQNENSKFTESSETSGLNQGTSARAVSWDCNFIDIDLDGDLDLWFSSGNINPSMSFSPNSIYLNDGSGTFAEVNINDDLINPMAKTMGSSWCDFDRDGDLDLITGDSNFGVRYFENNAADRDGVNWIAIDVEEVIDNNITLTSVGAKVDIEFSGGKNVRQIVKIGSGYSGSKDTTIHLGVPLDEKIESITVIWNDGSVAYVVEPEMNNYIVIDKSLKSDQLTSNEDYNFPKYIVYPIFFIVLLFSLRWFLIAKEEMN